MPMCLASTVFKTAICFLLSFCDDVDVQPAAETMAIGYCSSAPALRVIHVTSVATMQTERPMSCECVPFRLV